MFGLVNLFNDGIFEQELNSLFNTFKMFETPLSTFNNATQFTLKNGIYELSMDVDKNTNADNVEINLDKDNVLTITYQMKNDKMERIVKIKENIPSDADADTLDAEIINGKLIVTVNQLSDKDKRK